MSRPFFPKSGYRPITDDLARVENQGGKDRQGIDIGKSDRPDSNCNWQGFLRANNSHGAAGWFLKAEEVPRTCVSTNEK